LNHECMGFAGTYLPPCHGAETTSRRDSLIT
jgi:hypothetical protein